MNVPSNTYDAVIVGGGHNGLVAACYLARAGYDVCILERYKDVGGAAFSEEIEGAPGHIASTGSYVLSLAPQKVLSDLDLFNNGVEMIKRNPRAFAPTLDGQDGLLLWESMDDTIKEIARFSEKDAKAYPVYDAMIERACEIMDKYILRNPPSFAEFAAEFNQPGDEHVLKFMILGAVADSAEYYFESDIMQGAASALGLIGTFRGPRDAGTGYVKLYHAMGMATGKRGQWAYLRGAMGSFTQALKRVAQGLGVDIRTGKEVDHICVQGGRATGAVTKDGEEFHSRIVLSNADPKRTYLKLVGKQYLPDEYVRDIENIQITSPVMKINFACDRLPEYPGLRTRGYELGQTGGVHHRAEHRLPAARLRGRPPGTPRRLALLLASTPSRRSTARWRRRASRRSRSSPSSSPTSWPKGPGTSGATRSPSTSSPASPEYAPNMADAEITAQVLAPPDIEARFGLTGGHIFQGELVPEQAFDMRPVPGSQSYEGPISGLYLCGSGAWPGGCVMGAPGHNASHEAIERLRAGEYV